MIGRMPRMGPSRHPPPGRAECESTRAVRSQKGPLRGLKMSYHDMSTFWKGLGCILSPGTALLADNAKITYVAVD
jgi:hypothetical protein